MVQLRVCGPCLNGDHEKCERGHSNPYYNNNGGVCTCHVCKSNKLQSKQDSLVTPESFERVMKHLEGVTFIEEKDLPNLFKSIKTESKSERVAPKPADGTSQLLYKLKEWADELVPVSAQTDFLTKAIQAGKAEQRNLLLATVATLRAIRDTSITLMETAGEVDDLLAELEDTLHGDAGEKITRARGLLQPIIGKEIKNEG